MESIRWAGVYSNKQQVKGFGSNIYMKIRNMKCYIYFLTALLLIGCSTIEERPTCYHTGNGDYVFSLPEKIIKGKEVSSVNVYSEKENRMHYNLNYFQVVSDFEFYHNKGLKINETFIGKKSPSINDWDGDISSEVQVCFTVSYKHDLFPMAPSTKEELWLFDLPKRDQKTFGRKIEIDEFREWRGIIISREGERL